MLLSLTLTHFNANRHAFFLFNEYIIFNKNGPFKHIPLHKHLHKITQTLAQNIFYFMLTLPLS